MLIKQKLPSPPFDLINHSQSLSKIIANKIVQSDNQAIPFDEFMHDCLYTPSYGYYVGGLEKIGSKGDFVTAPEIGSLFGQCLAEAIKPLLTKYNGQILEIGPGRGALAKVLWQSLGEQIKRYDGLDVSPHLKKETELKLNNKMQVNWLNDWPDDFEGIIIANEVLDALPVVRFKIDHENGLLEQYVKCAKNNDIAFEETWLPARESVITAFEKINIDFNSYPNGYVSEICLALQPFLADMFSHIKHASVFLIDYGFDESRYYELSQSRGRFHCHYQHLVHDDWSWYPGLQDLTSHVNFTAVKRFIQQINSEVKIKHGQQSEFLLAHKVLEKADSSHAHELKQLLEPYGMGSVFQVLNATTK